jgi:hypothetical protein
MLQNIIIISTFFLNAKFAKLKQRVQSNLGNQITLRPPFSRVLGIAASAFNEFKSAKSTTYFSDNDVSFAIFVSAT